ncbi:MAG: 3'(2'),5'-bisphosphate nucleotidase [Micavibrio sp.]|nr:3'(2'),5'-bisphosphate nucleotidase [Micavibrio sp.]
MSSDKLLSYPKALCEQVKRLAVEAGDITLDYFDEGGVDSQQKEDGSPVTLADQHAEKVIIKGLNEMTPSVPVVGEESMAAGKKPDISKSDYFWLVDPLDGTKEFISGSGDFTVNIALIFKGEPVIGVVYAPYHGLLYAGFGLGTATKWLEDTDIEKKILTRRAPVEGLTVVASKSHGKGEKLDKFLTDYKVKKLLKKGSSLKICAVAAGKADIYPRFGPTCEWDTAAADAILRAAGGVMTDTNGNPLVYGGRREGFLNPEFIAWSGDLAPESVSNTQSE